jgi:hypothetical protein
MIRLAKLSFAFLLAGFGLIAGLGGMNLYTYHRFAGEAAVATLAFQRMDGEVYRVSLKPASGAEQQFELRGDEWQLDARMIKWTDSLYLGGRCHEQPAAHTRFIG